MSMKLTAQAMELRVGNPLRKLVLLKLCDNANDKGFCWPSMQYVADQCEITKRSVMTHIAILEAEGFLRVMQRAKEGKKISNLYLITLAEGIARRGESASASKNGEANFADFSGVSSEGDSLLSSELNSLLNRVSSESGSRSSEGDSLLSSEGDSHKPVIQPVIEPIIKLFNSISLESLPKEISPAAAREFVEHRNRIEKPVTQGAFDREMSQALAGCKFGLTADDVIRECIDAGWWNINPEWAHTRKQRRLVDPPPNIGNSKTISIAEQLVDRSWAQNKNNQSGGGGK